MESSGIQITRCYNDDHDDDTNDEHEDDIVADVDDDHCCLYDTVSCDPLLTGQQIPTRPQQPTVLIPQPSPSPPVSKVNMKNNLYSSIRWNGNVVRRGRNCCSSMTSTRRILVAVRTVVLYSAMLGLCIVVILWLGMEHEQYHVRRTMTTVANSPRRFHNNNSQQQQQQQPSATIGTTICGMIITTTTTTNASITNMVSNFDIASYPSMERFNETASLRTTTTTTTTTIPTSPSSSKTSITTGSTNAITTSNNTSRNTTTSIVTAHCGDCGQCSNPQDIQIYDDTKTTLFTTTTKCAHQGLYRGRSAATHCMKDHVSFTNECNDCWVDNIMCDLQLCIFTCLWYSLFRDDIDGATTSPGTGTTDGTKALNPCTICDETRCGPVFMKCAGANRRRCGIVSDIERHPEEVCTMVQPKQWWDATTTSTGILLNIQDQYHAYRNNTNRNGGRSSGSSSNANVSTRRTKLL